jgi:DNA-binding winged helix-turn-helix (wHTH) protein
VRLQFDDLTFDPDTRQLWLGETEAHVSPKAFDLLALLIERRPRAISKADIREHLWPGTFVSESNLPTLISELRLAIGDRARKRGFIRTLHARGYAFEAPEVRSGGQPTLQGTAADRWLIGSTAEIALMPGENVLGREGSGVILLKSSTVSRRHVRIVIGADAAVVEDLGSKNGTYVNDERLTGPTPIADGDQVRIGSLMFTYRTALPSGSTETLSSSRRSDVRAR